MSRETGMITEFQGTPLGWQKPPVDCLSSVICSAGLYTPFLSQQEEKNITNLPQRELFHLEILSESMSHLLPHSSRHIERILDGAWRYRLVLQFLRLSYMIYLDLHLPLPLQLFMLQLAENKAVSSA